MCFDELYKINIVRLTTIAQFFNQNLDENLFNKLSMKYDIKLLNIRN